MRKDMAEVIIETYRSKGNGKRRKFESGENAQLKESVRHGLTYFNKKELTDKLKPFHRFLLKAERKGRLFDDVFSEVCQVEGSRLLKAHIRQHFWDAVFKTETGKLKVKKLF
jgi:hypothetical protein